MNLFCKMIIGCNLEMMDFITHELWHCVIGVSKDSGVMSVTSRKFTRLKDKIVNCPKIGLKGMD